ncbi:hypothetical protein [Thalassotalea agarivorans]|nr:hypothetical protein [Thalassotalea agarivorans]
MAETSEEVESVRFWSCKSCSSRYTENGEGRLHDRWLMPITLALYGVIYEKEPRKNLEKVTADMRRKGAKFVELLIDHISNELTNPKQRMSDIHQFIHADEQQLRQFLALLRDKLINFSVND